MICRMVQKFNLISFLEKYQVRHSAWDGYNGAGRFSMSNYQKISLRSSFREKMTWYGQKRILSLVNGITLIMTEREAIARSGVKNWTSLHDVLHFNEIFNIVFKKALSIICRDDVMVLQWFHIHYGHSRSFIFMPYRYYGKIELFWYVGTFVGKLGSFRY